MRVPVKSPRLPLRRLAALLLVASSIFACSGPTVERGQVTLAAPVDGRGSATLWLGSVEDALAREHGHSLAKIVDNIDGRSSELRLRIDGPNRVCFSMDDYRSVDIATGSVANMFAIIGGGVDESPYDDAGRLALETSDGRFLEEAHTEASSVHPLRVRIEVTAADGTVRPAATDFMHYAFDTCFNAPMPVVTAQTRWLKLKAQLYDREEVYTFTVSG